MIRNLIKIFSLLILHSCNSYEVSDEIPFPIYQKNSHLINFNYPSGNYKNDSLLLSYNCNSQYNLKLIYKEDTIVSKGALTYCVKNLKPELTNIPTTTDQYTYYRNYWIKPKNKLSSFHKIQLFIFDSTKILDSSIFYYITSSKSASITPIVNLQVKRKLLFDLDSGCYVPGNNFLKDKNETSGNFYTFKRRKQNGYIEILDYKNLYLAGNFDFRIHGYRTPLSPQKSLRFYLNDTNSVNKILNVSHQVDKVILRSSYSGWGSEIFTDGLISEICQNLNVDVMAYRPAITYLNGEYWGIHGLRERMDLKAISNKYQIKKQKLIDADDKGFSKKKGYGDLNKLLIFIKENPNISYEYVKKRFKMKSLIDWFIIELFFQNTDWPCNNTFFWKKKKGKWSCVLIDMDACIGSPKSNMFKFVLKDRSPALGGVLINYMLKEKEFRKSFKLRAEYLMQHELSSENLTSHFLKLKKEFEPIINEHYQRWNHKDGLKKYNEAIDRIEFFCQKRGYYFTENMNAFYNKI